MSINGKDDGIFMKSLNVGCTAFLMFVGFIVFLIAIALS